MDFCQAAHLHSSQAGVSAFSPVSSYAIETTWTFRCRNSSFKNIWAHLTQAFSRCLVLCSVMGSCGSRSWSKPLTGNPTLMAPCHHSFCGDVFSIIRLLISRIRLLWLVYKRVHTKSSDVRVRSGLQNVNGCPHKPTGVACFGKTPSSSYLLSKQSL